ncbi:60S ribosomal protein L24 [Tulasnella sp. JGI-2019a]|nr:60S ribosomal protein L24 [Tulasnella sp. JGI-2019a]
MKVELDSFSGHKIYPSKGRLFVRGDSKIFRFGKPKHESLFHQRKNPRDISWTQVYRRQHRKGILEGAAKKKSRKTVKVQRGITGLSLAEIAARKQQAPAVRQKQREEAIAKAKAEKKEKEAKKAKENKPARAGGAAGAPKQSKQGMRGTGTGGKAGR